MLERKTWLQGDFILSWKKLFIACLMAGLIPYIITLAWTSSVEGNHQRSISTGKRLIRLSSPVNEEQAVMDLEDYLPGVVASQIPDVYEPEAIKAQTIIARTYLYKKMDGKSQIAEAALNTEYLTPGRMEERWGSDRFVSVLQDLETAASSTSNQVMKYEDQYIDPFFHGTSACVTRGGDADHPYLQSVPCPWDVEAKNYMQVRIWSPRELAETLKPKLAQWLITDNEQDSALEEIRPDQIQVTKTDAAGYVMEVSLNMHNQEGQIVDGEELADALGLESSCFTLSDFEGSLRAVCLGSGHGYGLCQYGAERMAQQGRSAEEILQYYYKNIVLTTE